MKKKLKIVIISVCLALVIAASGMCIWASNNPHFYIMVSKPISKTDVYIEGIMVGYYDTLGIPASKKAKETYVEIGETMSDVWKDFRDTCEAPTHLEIEVSKSDNGGTIITYDGTITTDGVTSDYHRQWEFDYKYTELSE